MKLNLAIKNTRKKLKDYGIYFLTLTLAVCIFYTFNSIDGQQKILGAETGNRMVMERLVNIIGYISIFISIILGCLIIYANNFLIKKRRSELGLYMSLGMGKGKISRILIIEEFIIGIGSLVIGLVLGIILSQGLAFLSANIFKIKLEEFNLVFSSGAMIKTIAYFTLIFLIVMLFNVVAISKYRLIELLNSKKKNEEIKVREIKVNIIILIIGVGTLIGAYGVIIKFGFWNMEKLIISIMLGCIGTVLFFYSIMSVLAYVIEKKRKVYYKELNIFTLKQIKSKLNTNFMSLSIVCLMLFVTISVLSLSIGFKNRELDRFTPFDETLSIGGDKDRIEKGEKNFDIPNEILDKKVDMKYIEKEEYDENGRKELIYFDEILESYADRKFKEDFSYEVYGPIVISLSDYNKIMKMKGKDSLSLKEDEYLLISTNNEIRDDLERFLKGQNGEIEVKGKKYIAKDNKINTEQILNVSASGNWLMIMVGNDEWVNKEETYARYYNINYNDISKKGKEYLNNTFKYDTHQSRGEKEETVYLSTYTKKEIQLEQSQGTIMMLYVSLYLGAIFFISSALVLAIKILSEAEDSKERYKALRSIGAREREINKSILAQVGVYYGFPLVLALIHSAVGIYIGNNVLIEFGKSSVVQSSIITVSFIGVIYISYLFIAYNTYKNIVKN